MKPEFTIKNPEEIKRAFKKLDALTQQSHLEAAVLAGLQPINNAAQEKARWKVGNLRRSIHVEILISRQDYCEGASGTNIIYGPRIEFGFDDTDALGRSYHQPAYPYMRPAFDENRAKAVDEMRESLHDILMALI